MFSIGVDMANFFFFCILPHVPPAHRPSLACLGCISLRSDCANQGGSANARAAVGVRASPAAGPIRSDRPREEHCGLVFGRVRQLWCGRHDALEGLGETVRILCILSACLSVCLCLSAGKILPIVLTAILDMIVNDNVISSVGQ